MAESIDKAPWVCMTGSLDRSLFQGLTPWQPSILSEIFIKDSSTSVPTTVDYFEVLVVRSKGQVYLYVAACG